MDSRKTNSMAPLVMEIIGTFFLVLIIALTGNPIAIGISLMTLVYLGGSISGAHYNPAVTFAMYLRHKISAPLTKKYIIAQFLGGILAVLVSSLIFSKNLFVTPEPTTTWMHAFAAETLFTFLLVATVLHVAASKKTEKNNYFGIAIGGALTLGALAVGNISGGALNPVVGVSPLIVNSLIHAAQFDPSLLFLYILGPFCGSMLASFFHEYTQKG